MLSALRGKRALDPLELELDSCEYHMSAGVQGSSGRVAVFPDPPPPKALSHRHQDFFVSMALGSCSSLCTHQAQSARLEDMAIP